MGLKDLFPGHFTPTEEAFESLWKNALFVVDANVLLGLYRYTQETRTELIRILNSLGGRFWCPHQVAAEFVRNRHEVIHDQRAVFDKFPKTLERIFEETIAKVRAELPSRHHPAISIDELKTLLANLRKRFVAAMKRNESHIITSHDNDPVLREVCSLLENKIGEAFPDDELAAVIKTGKERYQRKQGPGYKDADKKTEPDCYGDWFIWKQMLNYAEKKQKPMIFVTDDAKVDWWWKVSGQTIGPLPSLVEEYKKAANAVFYMYPSDKFVEFANEYLETKVKSSAVEEINAVKKAENAARDNELAAQTVNDAFTKISLQREIEMARKAVDRDRQLRSLIYTQPNTLLNFTGPPIGFAGPSPWTVPSTGRSGYITFTEPVGPMNWTTDDQEPPETKDKK